MVRGNSFCRSTNDHAEHVHCTQLMWCFTCSLKSSIATDDACAKAVAQDAPAQPCYENWAEKLESPSWPSWKHHCKEGCSQGEILSSKRPSCLGDPNSTVCQGPNHFFLNAVHLFMQQHSVRKHIMSSQDKLHLTIAFVQVSPMVFKVNWLACWNWSVQYEL